MQLEISFGKQQNKCKAKVIKSNRFKNQSEYSSAFYVWYIHRYRTFYTVNSEKAKSTIKKSLCVLYLSTANNRKCLLKDYSQKIQPEIWKKIS